MDQEAAELRHVTGIGPAIERKLHEAGVRTLADLAGWPTDELVNITGKSPQTVTGWQAEARDLTASAATGEESEPASRDRQRSETFTVEVLLNEDGTLRYVRCEHVYTQAGHAQQERAEAASWVDWDATKRGLPAFLEEHAGLLAHAAKPEVVAAEKTAQEPTAQPAEPEVAELVDDRLRLAEPAPAGRVGRLAAISSPAGQGGAAPSEDEPFVIRLAVDATEAGISGEGTLGYQATVAAKRLGQPWRQVIGQARGMVDAAAEPRFDIVVQSTGLAVGTYRLEAVVRFHGAEEAVALVENTVLEITPESGRQTDDPDRPSSVPLPQM